MPKPHFERGIVLFQQGRYEQAIGELVLHLGQEGEDSTAHALLANCQLQLEQYDAATEHAQRAIVLDPESSVGYEMLARVLVERRRFAEAQQAAEEALRLAPYDADCFALLSAIELNQKHWREALAAANSGLEIDPEHSQCTNFRAQALVMLGERAAAADTMGEALARRPDDAATHANQGWTLLHQGNPKQALIHFREALRLEPDSEWARAGIVESLKARNFLYRWLLAYFLWMARLPSRVQWILVIGALMGQQVVASLARESPTLAPILWPLLYAYYGFVVLSWLAYPLFNMLLRFDRFGRHALSADQVRGANLLAVCLGTAVAYAAVTLVYGLEGGVFCTIMLTLLCLPASAVFRCDEGWPRWTMAGITAGLALCTLYLAAVMPFMNKDWPLLPLLAAVALMYVLPWAMLGSQFAASFLANVRPER